MRLKSLFQVPSLSRHWRSLALALSTLTFTAAVGCSSDPDPDPTSTSTGTGGSSSSSSSGSGGDGTGGNGGAPVKCAPTKNAGEVTSVALESVEATLIDTTDAPIVGLATYACGINICPPPVKTDSKGHVLITANTELTRPALKYGDGLLYGKFAALLKDPKPVIAAAATPKLPAMGAPMKAGANATSGSVTLSIPAGAGIEIDTLTYDEPEKEGFRAAEIPTDKALPAVDDSLNLEILYAVAPVDTLFCPAASVTIPNSKQWAAGTEVEFFIHGVGVEEYYVPYAGWAKASDGVVSADGKTISTSPGGGLPILTVFGIRKK